MKTTLSTILAFISMAICSVFAAESSCPHVERADHKDWKSMEGPWWVAFRTPVDPNEKPYKCIKSIWNIDKTGLKMEAQDKLVQSETGKIDPKPGAFEIGPDDAKREESSIVIKVIDVDDQFVQVFGCVPTESGLVQIALIFVRNIPKDKSKLDEIEKRGKAVLEKNGVDDSIMKPFQLDDECPSFHK